MAHRQPREVRDYTTEFEIRAKPTGGVVVEGHAAVFNQLSHNLGGFVERSQSGAFAQTILTADVRALYNHDPSALLARTTSGTLRLSEDATGLAYDFDLPDTTVGRDLQVLMERGDLTQSSFGFRTLEDDWGLTNDGYPLRTLIRCDLNDGDISPVTYPAYPQTDSAVQLNAFASLAETRHLPIADLVQRAADGELAQIITTDQETEPSDERSDSVPLSVMKTLLDLRARQTYRAT